MCLLIFAHQVDPAYPLILAANRDEFHARPTAQAHYWSRTPELLAGRDLDQGGTWLGVTRMGRFAAVTNYRDPNNSAAAPRSRGELTLDYLSGDESAASYLARLQDRAEDYAGFNLLLGEGNDLWYYNNQRDSEPRHLQPGLYGLSNARLDTPWPKVELGKANLQKVLAQASPNHDELAGVVADSGIAAMESLNSLGMDGAMERLLSAQFIVNGDYGTRCTTTLWRDATGRGSFRELSFGTAGERTKLVEETF